MKSIRLFLLLAAVILTASVLIGCVPIQAPTPAPEAAAPADSNIIEATFVCPNGTELPTVFDNDKDTVTVQLPDGEVTLPRAESGSGARYSDGTTTFWNKGDEAMVQVNDETIYENCIAQ